MPTRTFTYQSLKADLDAGKVQPNAIYRLTISLTYSQFLEFLELREKLGKNMSDMVRDGVNALRIQRDRMVSGMDIQATVDKLVVEQRALQQQFQEGVKKLTEKEGVGVPSEDVEELKASILLFLEKMGPLLPKELAKLLRVDWKVVDKLCEDLLTQHLIEWAGSKWRLPA